MIQTLIITLFLSVFSLGLFSLPLQYSKTFPIGLCNIDENQEDGDGYMDYDDESISGEQDVGDIEEEEPILEN